MVGNKLGGHLGIELSIRLEKQFVEGEIFEARNNNQVLHEGIRLGFHVLVFVTLGRLETKGSGQHSDEGDGLLEA